jgi:hypothetical protein
MNPAYPKLKGGGAMQALMSGKLTHAENCSLGNQHIETVKFLSQTWTTLP